MRASADNICRASRYSSIRRWLPSIWASALLLLLSWAVTPSIAHATQAEYHADNSFYMTSTSASAIGNIGCNQGTSDYDGGYPRRVVVLDFGSQTSDGSGTQLINGTHVTNAQVTALAKNYATNWFNCTLSDAFTVNNIVIGTNNSVASATTTANGHTWTNLVDQLNSWASDQGYSGQVAFGGGDDMEPAFGGSNSAPHTVNWSNAYDTYSAGGLMWDYGSADGCPQASHSGGNCSNGWTQQTEYNVSYGTSDAVPLPEIYVNGQQQEWQQISWYKAPAYFIEGPMSDHDLDSGAYTHTQAWNQLWNELNAHSATAQNLFFNTIINNE